MAANAASRLALSLLPAATVLRAAAQEREDVRAVVGLVQAYAGDAGSPRTAELAACLSALCTLTAQDSEKRDAAGRAGIDCAVTALKRCLQHAPHAVLLAHEADVCKFACLLLANLADKSDERAVYAGSVGAVELVVSVLIVALDKECHEYACRAFANFLQKETLADNIERAISAGGFDALVGALKLHPGSVDVQRFGGWGLYKMIRNKVLPDQTMAAEAGWCAWRLHGRSSEPRR